MRLDGDEPAVVRFVDHVIDTAVRARASDIHFEPFECEFKIRYRIDGVLVEMPPPPAHLAQPVSSRIKVLSHLDIAERRLPQDGRLSWSRDGKAIDCRVSTLPTQFGESVVLRLLDSSAVRLGLAELGMREDILRGFEKRVFAPEGMVLVTGPTGSGKTTTLYSALRALNRDDSKLLTIEDPVEYDIEGIMQVGVNPAAGLDFAAALRAFLRQDPDVLMVGEIRDTETARVAVQASLTGHMVLSTLHTNDAAGAITRMADLGVEPHLLASTIEGVLAQRLVRRICPDCRASHRPNPDVLVQLGMESWESGNQSLFRGAGCPNCSGTGYRGRMGIFEWLPASAEIRELAGRNAPSGEIAQKAMEQGMRTLRQEGKRAVLEGRTTVDEVLRAT